MSFRQAFSAGFSGAYDPAEAKALAAKVRIGLGRPASLAFVFMSSDYLPFLAELIETLRVDGHITEVVGCTAAGRIEESREIEEGSGFSLLAMACETGEPGIAGEFFASPRSARHRPHAGLLLANPFAFATDDWLRSWNRAHPGVPCVGGLASGEGEDDVAVFLNDRVVDAAVVTLCGRTTIVPVLSQGCRPIGEPLTVTRAEHNIVYSLGGQPAYEALESAFEALSDNEKSVAKGNLFAGLAGSEYVEDFKPGDFLIRNIIGADPGSGAVVIGGIPRTGQTLQYQLREREIARADLDRAIGEAGLPLTKPVASLLFSCLSRGQAFFGEPDHDAVRISRATGRAPQAGAFCNGEIGPAGTSSAVHGHTASAAIWVEKSA